MLIRHNIKFLTGAVSAIVCCAMSPSLFAANCEGLTSLTLTDSTITAAKSVSNGSYSPPSGQPVNNLPAFCEVHGVIKPTASSAINFELWMPASNWNNELEGVGNGGLAGTIPYGPMSAALREGYATVSTDTGHDAKDPATWLEDRDRLIDYSYRGLHLATVTAKSIVDAYYGQNASHSYFVGLLHGRQTGADGSAALPC